MPHSSDAIAVAAPDGSAVAWPAVFAGAAGAAALSLILILLGTGVGLSVVSPWANEGASAGTLAVSTIVWITIVQALASVLGGYLAGRLRTRWTTVHTDEVFFRDTAHGFLAWAVSTLLMATLLSSAVASALSMGAKATGAESTEYFSEVLLRAPAKGEAADTPLSAEVARVLARAAADGELSNEDSDYLAEVVASRAGISESAAQQRVADTFAKVQTAADEARKATAYTSLWLVVSLLLGAFLASYAATFGGRLRDSSILVKA